MPFPIVSLQMLLICVVYFFAGIVDATCGGGGLLTIPAMLAAGVPAHLVSGTNHCSAFLGGATAFVRYERSGRVHWKSVLPALPVSMLAAILGARLNVILPEKYLKWVLMVLLPVLVVVLLVKRSFGNENRIHELSFLGIIVRSLLIGMSVGVYHGFYGAGAGMFYMFGFALLEKLDLITATGNARALCFFSSISAVATYAVSGVVLWPIVLCTMVFYMAGCYLGSGLAMTKGVRFIRPMFFLVLVVLFIKLAV